MKSGYCSGQPFVHYQEQILNLLEINWDVKCDEVFYLISLSFVVYSAR